MGISLKPKSKGKTLETLVLNSPGLTIVKVPNGIRYIGGGRKIAEKSPCDFFGVTDSGRAVVFDAKECGSDTRFPVGDKTHVEPHQIKQIVQFGEKGAVAGLLVMRMKTDSLYWIGWKRLIDVPPSFEWDDMRFLCSVGSIPWNLIIEADDYGNRDYENDA